MAKKQTAQKPADVEVLPITIPEQGLVQSDSVTIASFLNGLVPFFRTATELEQKAKGMLAKARTFTLPQPGDIDGDAALQTFIKDASVEIKAVDQHWGITSVVYQFQRKLTAARDRVTGEGGKTTNAGYLVEAKNIAQRLHNTYTEDAKRRAAQEQERLRREAEQQEQERRDRELAKMESEALEAEARSEALSEREARFVEQVVALQPHVVAARLAGYKDAQASAEKLMRTTKIVVAIQAKRDAAEIRRQAAAVKETPLDVQVDTVQVQRAKVGTDRTTYSAEVTDARLLLEAVICGRHGIPADVLTVDVTRLNAYARDMRDVINRWPGCKLVTKTTTV